MAGAGAPPRPWPTCDASADRAAGGRRTGAARPRGWRRESPGAVFPAAEVTHRGRRDPKAPARPDDWPAGGFAGGRDASAL